MATASGTSDRSRPLPPPCIHRGPSRALLPNALKPPANHRRRIQSGPLEHQRHHRGRAGLAVRAGDRDAEAQPHQLREHLGPRNHRDPPPRRPRPPPGCPAAPPTSRRRRRRRRHSPPRARRRTVTPSDSSRVGDGRPLRVRSRHGVAEIGEQLGDAAHADTADADEVNPPRLTEHASTPTARRDPQSAPPHPAAPAARAARRSSRRRRSGIRQQRRNRVGQRVPSSSRSSITTAAPARGQHLGVLPLVVVGRRRQRHQDRGRPDAASSASVVAPARQITTSAAFISPSIWKMKASTRASRPARWYAVRTRSRSRSPVWWVIARCSPVAASRDAASTMATLIACAP